MLEVLIASLMFTAAMISMMAVWISHARAIDKSQELQVAGSLAQQVMEMQRTMGYRAQPVTSQEITVERTMRGVAQNAVFQYEVQVAEGPPASGPSYKNVLVIVRWRDTGGDREFRLESNAGW